MLKDIENKVQWTHWYEVIPSFLAIKCIVVRRRKTFFKWTSDVQIFTEEGTLEWVHHNNMMVLND